MKDVFWVLTVPAIWSDKAKQFMRKSAEEVFIDYRCETANQHDHISVEKRSK